MKAFTRHRTPKSVDVVDERTPDLVEAPTAHDAPLDAGDDFIERLGDLDRFIGGPAAPAVTWPTTPPTRNLFTRPDEVAIGRQAAEPDPATHDTSEADDFMERLGDLDRFIGGPDTGPARQG